MDRSAGAIAATLAASEVLVGGTVMEVKARYGWSRQLGPAQFCSG